jgi:hypothetical protein
MGTIIPPRSIGGIIANVTVEELHLDRLEITDHPVEVGAVISDHAYVRPVSVTIHAGWSNGSGMSETYAVDTYNKLLALQQSRQPFLVLTGKRNYNNMLLESLEVRTTQETETSLMIQGNCRQVNIVSTTTTNIGSPSNQSNPSSTNPTTNQGQQQLQAAPNANTSALP